MLDKLEKHNNKKISYVINRRIEVVKNAVLSFFGLDNEPATPVFNQNYYFSTKK